MCTGILEAAQVFGAITSGASALKGFLGGTKQPDVVRTDPVADDAAAKAQAEQEAQAQAIEQKKKLRQNSLLSQAGAAGDLSQASTAGGGAQAKLTLGA